MTSRLVPIAALLALTAACSNEPAADANAADDVMANAVAPAPPVTIPIRLASGGEAGTATLSEDPNGVTLAIAASGMPAGTHGVHVHTTGKCEAPKYESAGAHWNPTAKQHGRDNPEGAHMGDMANLEIAADGTGASTFAIGGARLNDGANPLLDADGAALVIHAKADDYKTDPSGDSGDRVACAVLGAG